MSWLNSDTSALITFAETWLNGTDPYAKFNEINPPASILLYVPDVLVGRLFGFTPEAVLTTSLLVAVPATLWITAQILAQARLMDASRSWILAPFSCSVFLLIPEDVFGQREHIAVIAVLPVLALYAARASGKQIEGWTNIVAGAGAGLAIAIKPIFVFALILPWTYVAWTLRRRPKELRFFILSRENLVIVIIAAAYALVVVIWFREYLELMLPIAQHVYLPVRFPWLALIAKPSVSLPLLGLAAVLIIGGRRALKEIPLVFALATIGFWIGVLIQGKGWPYHGYPAIALTLVASLIVAINRWPQVRIESRAHLTPWLTGTIGLIGGLSALSSIYFWPAGWYPPFVSTVSRVAPDHPKLMAICGASIGYLWPVSRLLHGEAIGHGLWINDVTNALEQLGEVNQRERSIVDRYARAEGRSFVLAMRTQHPSVLIVCNDRWKDWALARPEFAIEMGKFHKVAQVERAEIWLPN